MGTHCASGTYRKHIIWPILRAIESSLITMNPPAQSPFTFLGPPRHNNNLISIICNGFSIYHIICALAHMAQLALILWTDRSLRPSCSLWFGACLKLYLALEEGFRTFHSGFHFLITFCHHIDTDKVAT